VLGAIGLMLAVAAAFSLASTRRGADAAMLERVIAYHESRALRERDLSDRQRAPAGPMLAGAARDLGLALLHGESFRARLGSTEGPSTLDWQMAIDRSGRSLESARFGRHYLREAAWHDRRSRYHRAAAAYYRRLLAARPARFPSSAPELAARRAELEQTHLSLYGTGAELPPEPPPALIPGRAPLLPGDPHADLGPIDPDSF
jgi:hypothetical protein